MPTKTISCKKEAICEHGPEAQPCPVAKAHLKWTVSKWSDESKFDILVGNHGSRVLQANACFKHAPSAVRMQSLCVTYDVQKQHGLIVLSHRMRLQSAPDPRLY